MYGINELFNSWETEDTSSESMTRTTTRSELGKTIEESFFELQEAVRLYDEKNPEHRTSIKYASVRRTYAQDFFSSHTFKKIQVALLKYCNIALQLDVLNSNMISSTKTQMIAIIPNNNLSKLIFKEIYKIKSKQKYRDLVTEGDKELFSNPYKFKQTVSATLFFDTWLIAFGKELGKAYDFSPAEITAIFLHEIGHVFNSMIFGYLAYSITQSFRDNTSIINSGSRKQKEDLIKSLNIQNKRNLQLLKQHKDQTGLDKNALNKIEKLINIYNEALSRGNLLTMSHTTLTIIVHTLSYIGGLSLIFLCFSIILVPMMLSLLQERITSKISEGMTLITTRNKEQEFSRGTITTKNIVANEFRADDFTIYNGYGSFLSTSLLKYMKLIYEDSTLHIPFNIPIFNRSIQIEGIARPTIIYSYMKFLRFVTSPLFVFASTLQRSLISESFKYEPTDIRLEQVMISTKGVLKNTSLPVQMKKQLLDEIKETEKFIKRNAIYNLTKVFRHLFNIVTGEFFITKLINNVYDSGTISELGKIFRTIDALIDNPLSYQAARFEVLVDTFEKISK